MNKNELVAAYKAESLPLLCHWCKREFDDALNPPTKEHLTPRGAGGSDDRANLVLACEPCNHMRGEIFHRDQEKEMRGIIVAALHKLDQAPFPLRRRLFLDPSKRSNKAMARMLREELVRRPSPDSRAWVITDRGREYLDRGLRRAKHAARYFGE